MYLKYVIWWQLIYSSLQPWNKESIKIEKRDAKKEKQHIGGGVLKQMLNICKRFYSQWHFSISSHVEMKWGTGIERRIEKEAKNQLFALEDNERRKIFTLNSVIIMFVLNEYMYIYCTMPCTFDDSKMSKSTNISGHDCSHCETL